MRSTFLTTPASALLLTILCPSPVRAQSDFAGLKLNAGAEVYVVQPSGIEVFGHVTELSPTLLGIDRYRFAPESVLRIERRGDSLKNGILIGAGIGAALGGTLGAEACLHEPAWRCVAGGAIGYGALGALLDWARVGRTTVYQLTTGPVVRSYRVIPTIEPHRKAVALALAF